MPNIPAPNSWLQTRLKFISKPKAKFTQLWLSHVQRLQDFPQLSQTTCVHISSCVLVVLDQKKNRSHWSSLLCLSRMHPARKDSSCRTKTLHLALKNGSVLIVVWCPSLPMIHHSLNGCRKLFSRLPQTWPRRQLANARSTGNAKPLILSGIPQNPTLASFWIKDQKRSKTIKDFHTGSGSISGRKAIG